MISKTGRHYTEADAKTWTKNLAKARAAKKRKSMKV